jgi:hypothetical protein
MNRVNASAAVVTAAATTAHHHTHSTPPTSKPALKEATMTQQRSAVVTAGLATALLAFAALVTAGLATARPIAPNPVGCPPGQIVVWNLAPPGLDPQQVQQGITDDRWCDTAPAAMSPALTPGGPNPSKGPRPAPMTPAEPKPVSPQRPDAPATNSPLPPLG